MQQVGQPPQQPLWLDTEEHGHVMLELCLIDVAEFQGMPQPSPVGVGGGQVDQGLGWEGCASGEVA